MKGTLIKTEQGWMVRYDVMQDNYNYPYPIWDYFSLHPDDVKSINDEYWSFIRKIVFDFKEVEFEIVTGCCTPEGQVKRYIDCKGCDKKPSYAKLVDKLGNEDVPKLGYDEKGKPLTYWGGKQSDVREVVEDDVEKLALEEAKKLHCIGKYERYNDLVVKEAELIKLGIKVAKSTLYTKEQVERAYFLGVSRGNGVDVMSIDTYIQSLKQPKKD